MRRAVGSVTSLAERKARAGQRLLIGIAGGSVDADTRALIKEIQPAGFILFSRNVEEPAQVRELNRELASLVDERTPAILSVDQEGGRVQRIKDGASRLPPLRHLGNVDSLEITAAYARLLANEVRAMGFNLNWAPIADVDSNPGNPIIGDRSFSRDPYAVAKHVAQYIESTQELGVMACAKHFPGHGDTATDSHLTLPTVEKDIPELTEVELRPFVSAIQAKVATMMTAHVVFPAWDEGRPATMSKRILSEILRTEMGFEGLIVSDDLEMKAVRGRYPLREQLDQACKASVDLFLVCKEPGLQQESFEELVRLQEDDKAHDQLAIDAMARLQATRERFFLEAPQAPGMEVLDSAEHKELLAMIQDRGAE